TLALLTALAALLAGRYVGVEVPPALFAAPPDVFREGNELERWALGSPIVLTFFSFWSNFFKISLSCCNFSINLSRSFMSVNFELDSTEQADFNCQSVRQAEGHLLLISGC